MRLLALTTCASLASGCAAESPPEVRGVVLYLVDTLRADHLSCYGYERPTSPALDALAAEGILFENCLSQSSWTKPSTASVLTGLYPAQHRANKEAASMPDEVVTLAERLEAAGVRTAGFYANAWLGEKHNLGQGFSTWEFIDRSEDARTREVVDQALAFLDSLEDERFFLYLHVTDPHAPYEPPPPFDTRFTADYTGDVTGDYGLTDKTQGLGDLSEADLAHLVDLYDGEIAYTDSELGRFVAGLRSRGRLLDTVLIFTADHGEEFREHGGWRHNPRLFQEVVHVPLVARFPGGPAGRRHDGLTQQIDIVPTILATFGLPRAEELDGRDLRNLALRGEDGPVFGFAEVDSGGMYRKAVVGDGKKLVRIWAPTPGELLFDLEEDPDELHDLATANPAVGEFHRKLLDLFVASSAEGYHVLIQNGGDELMKVECLLFADVDHPRITSLYTEDMSGYGDLKDGFPEIGDIEWNGRMRKGTRLVLRVEPGDGDGVSFVPADGETELEVVVRLEGEPVPAERVLLGAEGVPARSMPYVLDLTGSDSLTAPMFPARAELGGEPYRVRLWRGETASSDAIEFSEDELDRFRALGYFGDE